MLKWNMWVRCPHLQCIIFCKMAICRKSKALFPVSRPSVRLYIACMCWSGKLIWFKQTNKQKQQGRFMFSYKVGISVDHRVEYPILRYYCWCSHTTDLLGRPLSSYCRQNVSHQPRYMTLCWHSIDFLSSDACKDLFVGKNMKWLYNCGCIIIDSHNPKQTLNFILQQ